MGLRTITLKLHKPGKGKREILDGAIARYNEAFRFLLGKACENPEELRGESGVKNSKYATFVLSKRIGKDTLAELNKFDVQPFKDSLKIDFGMTLAGYLKMRQARPETGFPAPDAPRPVYFCRYDVRRCYSLLYNKDKDRFYAKLYLTNRRNARELTEGAGESGRLVYIGGEGGGGEKAEDRKRRETFIIVPLSFGRWQEKILKEAVGNPECLRTARLYKKKDEYYLAVSIDTGDAERIGTVNYMGVSRGLKNKLNYTIVDKKGRPLTSGAISPGGGTAISEDNGPSISLGDESGALNKMHDRHSIKGRHKAKTRSRIPADLIHAAANRIAEIAAAHKAAVIVQNLTEKGDGLTRIMNAAGADGPLCGPIYRIKDYNRLVSILEYKLPGKGLPKPVKVSSVDIYTTCCECGRNSKSNEVMNNMFLCTTCGAAMDIEKLGSFNLAGKLISYSDSPIKIKVARTRQGVMFSNKILGLKCCCDSPENGPETLRRELAGLIAGMGRDGPSGKARRGAGSGGGSSSGTSGAEGEGAGSGHAGETAGMRESSTAGKAADGRVRSAREAMIRKLASAKDMMSMIEYIT